MMAAYTMESGAQGRDRISSNACGREGWGREGRERRRGAGGEGESAAAAWGATGFGVGGQDSQDAVFFKIKIINHKS